VGWTGRVTYGGENKCAKGFDGESLEDYVKDINIKVR
jgi:hypothetical protein